MLYITFSVCLLVKIFFRYRHEINKRSNYTSTYYRVVQTKALRQLLFTTTYWEHRYWISKPFHIFVYRSWIKPFRSNDGAQWVQDKLDALNRRKLPIDPCSHPSIQDLLSMFCCFPIMFDIIDQGRSWMHLPSTSPNPAISPPLAVTCFLRKLAHNFSQTDNLKRGFDACKGNWVEPLPRNSSFCNRCFTTSLEPFPIVYFRMK